MGCDEIPSSNAGIIIDLLHKILAELKDMNNLLRTPCYSATYGPGTVEVDQCNCDQHKPGESTGGWYCPVHGQQS